MPLYVCLLHEQYKLRIHIKLQSTHVQNLFEFHATSQLTDQDNNMRCYISNTIVFTKYIHQNTLSFIFGHVCILNVNILITAIYLMKITLISLSYNGGKYISIMRLTFESQFPKKDVKNIFVKKISSW